MKQVIQSFKTSELIVADVPTPILRPEGILVRTARSLVSTGTERMLVNFAEKNLIQKAQARPDLVKQVLDKVQREGLLNTIDSVRNRFDQPLPLGYSTSGRIVEVGSEVTGFQIGDRVACAGGGYANHAEMGYIPRNLAVKLPDAVSHDAAAFTTLGAIALQGIRLADIQLGHHVAVIGLGLLGQLTIQMLKAAGCQVLGIDINPQRVELAREMGANDACVNEAAVGRTGLFTGGYGFDAVLITADTSSDEPVALAGELARDKGVVVAVGAVGMHIPRKVYYEKELDFRISRSYGPGRYDSDYEEKGHDYPYGYVRWTQQRNMAAFVQLVADGHVRVDPLITHRFAIDDAAAAYNLISGKTDEKFLGVLLTYDTEREVESRVELSPPTGATSSQDSIRLGMVGAGNFPTAVLLPAMKDVDGLSLTGIVSGRGLSASHSGNRFGFSYATSSYDDLLTDPQTNWVAITTRHNLHAEQTIAALKAGKDVFVEKPLAMNRAELVDIYRAAGNDRRIMVGFNRRFAPMVAEMDAFLKGRQRPLVGMCRVNAGAIPRDHWTQDPEIGGGRIIGEACHFIDLLIFFFKSHPVSVYSQAIQTDAGIVDDEVVITLTFADGSIGTVMYAAGGDKSYGKERFEIIGDGRIAVLDNYQTLELVKNGKRQSSKARLRPDKGHHDEWVELVKAIKAGQPTPISMGDIAAGHLASFAAVESLQQKAPVAIDMDAFWRDVQATEKITLAEDPSA
ncbi:MAG: oxidoreductase [Anaerolineaceae bacterium]|nr:oxidoreductase [Anaerolineaceae bacterium]